MKGLLQSKKFRTNLYKWLFMYAGVMLLLTSVITYSKYITSMETNEESRVAKFEVGIDYMNCADVTTPTEANPNRICNSGMYRPTSEIKYYFSVDTTQIETHALFLLDITVDSHFTLVGLKDFTNNKQIDISGVTNGKIRLTENIVASKGKNITYEVRVIYNGTSDSYKEEQNYNNIVKVGYSATQIK